MTEASITLVAGCDEDFARPLAVTLFSALKHLDPAQPVTLYLIDGGVSPESRMRIERVARRVRRDVCLAWRKPQPEEMQYLAGARHLSPATYLRLFIPDLLPPEVTRALYVDSDFLIRADLRELWNTDLSGVAVAAARDFIVTQIDHPYSGVKDHRALGLDPQAPYFNAGLLLMDVGRWRRDRIAAKALSYAVKHGAALGNCDQDALNATLPGDWLPLDYRWNVQSALFYLHDLSDSAFTRELSQARPALLKEAKIIHFTGTPKPWNHWSGHPATEDWVKHLLESGWYAPAEAAKWALAYRAKRALFKIKVALHLSSRRERVT